MFTIDIDTGGTCTDGFISKEGEFKTVKVLTTPHDLTVCFADCIKEGAELFDISVREMLAQTDVIRYSTTTGVNALITKSGSKIGLIVSKGYKDTLYAEESKQAEPVFELVSKDFITEINEAVDDDGTVAAPLNKEEVLASMQYLIDMGARAIVVSLRNSHINPSHEKACKAIIKDQYPNFYLGSVRVFLASEVSDQPGAFARTNTVVANGYIHDALVKYLYKAEDDLRSNFCAHPLMVAHSHGGVARVAKTRAIDTYSSGPALGVIGAGCLGKQYGFANVITVDIGGTSLDIGLIRDGAYSYDFNPVINGFPISVPMITTHSAPIASGSIGRLDPSKKMQVGPKSAGARPGPVCFDLGGMEPTVTDADVVLGFIDPNYFLGGRIKLNKAKAESMIKLKIADRLGISVGEAAWMIREKMGKMTSREILSFAASHGIRSEDLADFTMVVYGGAGPTHYADFIRTLGFGHSIATPYASVFSAYGASTTDLLHSYSKFVSLKFHKKDTSPSDINTFNAVVHELIQAAQKDIRGEGFLPDNALYTLELKGAGEGELEPKKITLEKLLVESEVDVESLCAGFGEYADGAAISTIILNARVPMPHVEAKAFEPGPENPEKAFKTSRPVFWTPQNGYEQTPVYEMELLMPGNIITGPAVVEGKDTTYAVPKEMSLHIDQYANIVMKR
jgi:N-methylhydantoinase A